MKLLREWDAPFAVNPVTLALGLAAHCVTDGQLTRVEPACVIALDHQEGMPIRRVDDFARDRQVERCGMLCVAAIGNKNALEVRHFRGV